MLLNFKFKNWKSFAEENEISCYSSYVKQHGNRRAYIKKYKHNILPVKAIFGGNAAGKSNVISALEFLRSMITESINIQDKIAVKTFEFDESLKKEPVEFELQFLVEEYIYHYRIIVTRDRILEEELRFENSKSIHLIFSRNKNKFEFGKKYNENKHFEFAAEGTKENKLFLRNAIEQGLQGFGEIYQWFQNLTIISPNSNIIFPKISPEELKEISNNYLSCLDTGIKRLELQEVNINSLGIPPEVIGDVRDNLNEENPFAQITDFVSRVSYYFQWIDEEVKVYKYMAVHNTRSGEKTFDLEMESDGTRRVIEFIPVFQDLVIKKNKIIVIDELDRSLHTQLTRALLELFLNQYDKEKRSQLIFTTHDMMLMDQSLLRRDEMDLVERNKYSESQIYSIADFENVRYDTDLRKQYLDGRFGGNPKICEIFI